MADPKTPNFDPYHRWLGIPKAHRPPTHYQLLGLAPGESDADVIEEAAVRQTTYLRSYQVGAHAAECTRILNEIAQARLVLLDPKKRKAYDAKIAAAPISTPSSAPAADASPSAFDFDDTAIAAKPTSKSAKKAPDRSAVRKQDAADIAKKGPPVALIAGVAGGVLALLAVGVGVAMMAMSPVPPRGPLQGNLVDKKPDPDHKPDPKPDPRPDPKVVKPPLDARLQKIPGLLASWSFDEGQGAQAIDSAKGLKATLTGATWTAGVRGKAVQFSADGECLDFSTAPGLNFGAGQPFTITGWMKTQSQQGAVVSMRNLSDSGALLDLLLSGGRLVAMSRENGNDAGRAEIHSGPVNDDNWHHFALVRRNQSIEIFVDGHSHGAAIGPRAGGAITTDLRALGAELFWQRRGGQLIHPYMRGAVDDFCIFQRDLTPAEIRSLVDIPERPPLDPSAGPKVNPSDLFGYWEADDPRFDLRDPRGDPRGDQRGIRQFMIYETGGWHAFLAHVRGGTVVAHARAEDTEYNNGRFKCTMVYEQLPSDVPGPDGQPWPTRVPVFFRLANGLLFETDENGVPKFTYRRSPTQELEAAYTGTWSASLEDGRTFRYETRYQLPWFHNSFSSSDGKQTFDGACLDNRIRGQSLVFDWRHKVADLDGCNRVVMTADGDKVFGEFQAVTKDATKRLAKLTFARGKDPEPNPLTPPPEPKEVGSPMKMPGLVAYWKLDEGKGATATDVKGGLRATLKGGKWTDGVRGKAVKFDADGDHLDLGNSPDFDLKENEPFTFAFWVKTRTERGAVFALRDAQRTLPFFDFLLRDGRLFVFMHPERSPHDHQLDLGPVSDGEWHHVAFTRNGKRAQAFLDGELRAQRFHDGIAGAIPSNQRAFAAELKWILEKHNDHPYMKGAIDEFCFFRRPLTSVEIRTLAGPAKAAGTLDPAGKDRFADYRGDWEHVEEAGQKVTRQLAVVDRGPKRMPDLFFAAMRDQKVFGHGRADQLEFKDGVASAIAACDLKYPGGVDRFPIAYRFEKGQIVEIGPGNTLRPFRRVENRPFVIGVTGSWVANAPAGVPGNRRIRLIISRPDHYEAAFSNIEKRGAALPLQPCRNARIRGQSLVIEAEDIAGFPGNHEVVLTPDEGGQQLKGEVIVDGKRSTLSFGRESARNIETSEWACHDRENGVTRNLMTFFEIGANKWNLFVTLARGASVLGAVHGEKFTFNSPELRGEWAADIKPPPALAMSGEFAFRVERDRLVELDADGKIVRVYQKDPRPEAVAPLFAGRVWYASLADARQFRIDVNDARTHIAGAVNGRDAGAGNFVGVQAWNCRVFGRSLLFETHGAVGGIKGCKHVVLTAEGPNMRCDFHSSFNTVIETIRMTRDASGVIAK